jgi:hypothetical protein
MVVIKCIGTDKDGDEIAVATEGKLKAIGRCREYEGDSDDSRAAIACMRARQTLEAMKAAV